MKLEWASATHPGKIRVVNQDAWYGDGRYFAVADGMGGHVGGEVASEIAIEAFREVRDHVGHDSNSRHLSEAFRNANAAILDRSNNERGLRGMGTTLTAAQFLDDGGDARFEIQSIGDSRAYLYHDDELHQITDDHTYVQELIRSGSISEEEGRVHKQRHILTRVLGVESNVRVDSFLVKVEPGDVILLCSDGLFNHVLDPTIRAILGRGGSIQEIADDLVHHANEGGGSDNITVVVVRVSHDGAGEGAHRRQETYLKDDDVSPPSAGSPSPRMSVNPISRGPVLSSIPTHLTRREVGGKHRIITPRSAIFMILLLALFGAAALLVDLYANHAYFVGKSEGRVAIFKGRPGGILWFNPSLVERSSFSLRSLSPAQSLEVSHDITEPSLSAARTFIRNLALEAPTTTAPVSTTTTSTTQVTTTSGAG